VDFAPETGYIVGKVADEFFDGDVPVFAKEDLIYYAETARADLLKPLHWDGHYHTCRKNSILTIPAVKRR
jgi:hypothetical protein